MATELRVLVVDDEPGMRMGVRRALQDHEVDLPDMGETVRFAVDQAESGEDGLAAIDAAPPDLLLLDHKLPGISGMDVLDRVTERKLDVQTIMITAYASLETAISATKRGAFDFLAKPFTPTELKAAVRKAARHIMLQRQARRLAEEKRQVRFQFISVLAHELKSPIAAVEGYLRLIQDRTLGENLQDYAQMIDRSLLRMDGMRKLIFDLLDLTRIESGQLKRDLKPVDVRDILQDSIDGQALTAEQRGIAIEMHAEGPTRMTGDRGELAILFNNLVSNAVKYNRDGGRVTIAVTGDEQTLRVAVTDTGIGMTPEEVDRLFKDFVRIKNEKTKNILGSGLGLSTVKKLALLYGGDVTVDSEPDKGSTFTAILQRHTEAEPTDEPERDTTLAADGRPGAAE